MTRRQAYVAAWWVVLAAVLVVFFMWAGTVAENRWCGPVICETDS
jgi:hypothetical protein